MEGLLMPKATAAWLIENTALTFEQIAEFCSLHILEVRALADDENNGIMGVDPTSNGQLTHEEIARCEADATSQLQLAHNSISALMTARKGGRYVSISKRQDRPDGILWLVRTYPDLSDAMIAGLMGTTRTTIQAIRNKTHWNYNMLKPRSPVSLGICSQEELDRALTSKKAEKAVKPAVKKVPVKKKVTKKLAVKKMPEKKVAAKKAIVKKVTVKKAVAKPAAKKTVVKKAAKKTTSKAKK